MDTSIYKSFIKDMGINSLIYWNSLGQTLNLFKSYKTKYK